MTRARSTQPRPPRRRLVTLDEAAEYWATSKFTIRRRIADGTIKAVRLPHSRSIRVDLADLDATLTPVPSAGGAA